MKTILRERLLKALRCNVRENVPLAEYTSFRIGGPATLLAEPATMAELVSLLQQLQEHNADYFYLGLGSNILVSDEGLDVVVVRATGELTRIWQDGNELHAGPAARLLDLTAYAAVRGLSGMEQLSGIPGTVGGGLYMNAGAYGKEICETFSSADLFDAASRVRRIAGSEVGFAYRSAPAFKQGIILGSRYRLVPGERKSIFAEMRRVWKLRRAKQPLEFPSAGSIFKRPPGDFAGRLIEAVGGKGVKIGGAMIPEKHAGIFINVGGATAADVCNLVREIRLRVYQQFGILLETEVIPVGFSGDPFQITT